MSVFGDILVRISAAFSRIRTEYGEIRSITPSSVRMRENAGKMRTSITPNTDIFYAVEVRFRFNCIQVSDLQLFKKETLPQVFSCEFCEMFKNTIFYGTLLVAPSDYYIKFCRNLSKLQPKNIAMKYLKMSLLSSSY